MKPKTAAYKIRLRLSLSLSLSSSPLSHYLLFPHLHFKKLCVKAHFTVMAGNGQLLPFGATLRAHCLPGPAWSGPEPGPGLDLRIQFRNSDSGARCRSRLIKTEIHNGPQATPVPSISISSQQRLPAHSLSGVKVKENFMFYVFLQHFFIFFTAFAKFFIIIFWTTRSACKQSLSQRKKQKKQQRQQKLKSFGVKLIKITSVERES